MNCMENLAEVKLTLLQHSAVGDLSQERGRMELCFKRQPAIRSDLTSYYETVPCPYACFLQKMLLDSDQII